MKIRLIVCTFCILLLLGLTVHPVQGRTEFYADIDKEGNVKVKVGVIDVNENISLDENTTAPLYDVAKAVYDVKPTEFYDSVLSAINYSFYIVHNITINNFSITFDDDTHSSFLNYSFSGLREDVTIEVPNVTRRFDPQTWLFDIINQSTEQTLKYTYKHTVVWKRVFPNGTINANIDYMGENYNYTLDLTDFYDFAILEVYSLDSWNRTDNIFSANISIGDRSLYGVIRFPENSRNITVDFNLVTYYIPEVVTLPLSLGFGIIGAFFVSLGAIYYMISLGRAPKREVKFKEKWKDRHKRKSKRSR